MTELEIKLLIIEMYEEVRNDIDDGFETFEDFADGVAESIYKRFNAPYTDPD